VVDNREKKQYIQTVFNQVSEVYDNNDFFSLSAKKMISLIQLDNKRGKKILDITTGTGIVALEAAKAFPEVDIIGLDLSDQMLLQAQSKADLMGIDNISFRQLDIEHLDYPKQSFDVISCGYGLFFLPDLEGSFKAIFNTLKDNGMFIFSTFTEEAFAPYNQLFLERLKRFNVEPPELSWKLLQSNEAIEKLCRQCAVKNLEIVPYPIAYQITIETWWQLLNSAGYKGLLNQLPDESFDEFKKQHMTEVSQLAVDGKLFLNANTLYGIVTK